MICETDWVVNRYNDYFMILVDKTVNESTKYVS